MARAGGGQLSAKHPARPHGTKLRRVHEGLRSGFQSPLGQVPLRLEGLSRAGIQDGLLRG